MSLYLAFFLWVVFGFLCMHIARKKNRNPYLWFIGGFFFTIFAFGIVLFLPNKTDPKQSDLTLQKAKQPQNLDESYSEQSISLSTQAEQIKALQPPGKKELLEDQKLWYYLDLENKQHGPMTFQALANEWHEGKIQKNTYVWNEEFEDWKPLESLSEFKNLQNPQN